MNLKANNNLSADVVIIGSGGGTVAAVAAAEQGAKVTVLEKQNVFGGNTRMAFGFWACESPIQERENIHTSKDEYFKTAMKWAHWYRVNPRVVRAYINKSGDTVRWLEGKGVRFDINSVRELKTAHVPLGNGAKLMEIMLQHAGKYGVQFFNETIGKKIVLNGTSGVSGVIAEKGGKEFEINTKSVIVATGGFTGNTELLKKYCPDYHEGMYTGNWPNHTGDGLILASEAGAEIMENIPVFHVGPVVESSPRGSLANIIKDPFTIWINKSGRRFIDEAGYMVWEAGNSILMQQDKVMFCLFDNNIQKNMMERGILASHSFREDHINKDFNLIPAKIKEHSISHPGEALIADSLEEIANWIGAEPHILRNTVNEYNKACSKGYDPVFAKDNKFLLQIQNPPYFCVKGITDCGETMGGIKVNEFMEVQTADNKSIKGLYAAGVIADGWESQTYCCDEMAGTAFGFAINSGRIAGENSAKFVTDK